MKFSFSIYPFFTLFLITSQLFSQVDLDINFDQISRATKNSLRYNDPKAKNQFSLIDLPMPNGEVVEFALTHSPLAKADSPLYEGPAGQTYNIHAPYKSGYNGSFVYYDNGIHATLNTPDGLLFIERTDINSEKTLHTYTYFKDTEGFIHNPHDAIKSHLDIDELTEKHSHGESSKLSMV